MNVQSNVILRSCKTRQNKTVGCTYNKAYKVIRWLSNYLAAIGYSSNMHLADMVSIIDD